jgi:hypothetical protein
VALTPLATGRGFGGAASLRSYSPAFSINVFLLYAGSGTDGVSSLFAAGWGSMGGLQPEGLCLIAIAPREFMFDSCSSPRGRPCDGANLGTWEGSFKPVGLDKPCDAPSS